MIVIKDDEYMIGVDDIIISTDDLRKVIDSVTKIKKLRDNNCLCIEVYDGVECSDPDFVEFDSDCKVVDVDSKKYKNLTDKIFELGDYVMSLSECKGNKIMVTTEKYTLVYDMNRMLDFIMKIRDVFFNNDINTTYVTYYGDTFVISINECDKLYIKNLDYDKFVYGVSIIDKVKNVCPECCVTIDLGENDVIVKRIEKIDKTNIVMEKMFNINDEINTDFDSTKFVHIIKQVKPENIYVEELESNHVTFDFDEYSITIYDDGRVEYYIESFDDFDKKILEFIRMFYPDKYESVREEFETIRIIENELT